MGLVNNIELRKILSFISDILLCYALAYLLLSQEEFIKIIGDYYPEIETVDVNLGLKQLILAIFFFIIYRVYFALMFGLSFFEFASGLKIASGSALEKRLSSVLRVFCLPIIILVSPFDHFLRINGKKTVDRILTGQELDIRVKPVTFILSFVGVLFSLILCLYGPLLYKNTFIFNPKVTFTTVDEKPIDKNRNFSLFKNYGSKAFQFYTFSDLDSGRFVLDPTFEIKKVKGNIVYRPMISVFDSTYGIKGIFKINNRFNTYRLLKKLESNYPFFVIYYPALSEYLDNNEPTLELNEDARQELFELITNSLYANPFTAHELIKKGRINIFPYVYLKRELFDLVSYEDGMTVDFVRRGDHVFLRTLSKNQLKNDYRESFFSLSELSPIVYEIIWEGSKWNHKVNDLFTKSFFYKSKWGSAVEAESANWASQGLYNPLSILDVTTGKYKEGFDIARFDSYIMKYFDDKKSDAYKFNFDYRRMFMASIQRMLVVMKIQKNKGEPFYNTTIKYLTDLLRELKEYEADKRD